LAQEAFASVSKMDDDIWQSEQTFEEIRAWANAP